MSPAQQVPRPSKLLTYSLHVWLTIHVCHNVRLSKVLCITVFLQTTMNAQMGHTIVTLMPHVLILQVPFLALVIRDTLDLVLLVQVCYELHLLSDSVL